MPYPNGTYITQILDPNVKNELDQFYSLLQGYLSNQHKDDGSHGNVTADSLIVNGLTKIFGDLLANAGTIEQIALQRSATGAGNSQTSGPTVAIGRNDQDWAWAVVANEAKLAGASGRRQLVFLRRGVTGPDKGILALSTDDSNTAGVYYLYPPSGSGATVHIGAPTGTPADAAAVGNVYCAEVFEAGRSTGMGYWTTYSPTLTNITVGNGTVVARYAIVGKIVRVYVSFTLGSTSAMGTAPTVSLPVTANANTVGLPVGVGEAVQTGTAAFGILTRLGSSTVALPLVQNLTGGYVSQAQITATVPFTWASTHLLNLSFAYEMA